MPEWLWQGLLTNGIYALLILGGGVMFAYLKKQGSAWVPAFSYGLGGAAGVAVVILCFRGIIAMPHTSTQITSDNVESSIVGWANSLGTSESPIEVPDTAFAYKITLSDGVAVIVARHKKNKPGYIYFQSGIAMSPAASDALGKLTDEQATTVLEELSLELARSKLEYGMSVPLGPKHLQGVVLTKGVALSDLTEATFVQAVDEVDSATGLVKASVSLSIQRQSPQATPPAVMPPPVLK